MFNTGDEVYNKGDILLLLYNPIQRGIVRVHYHGNYIVMFKGRPHNRLQLVNKKHLIGINDPRISEIMKKIKYIRDMNHSFMKMDAEIIQILDKE